MPEIGMGSAQWQQANWANHGDFNVGWRPDHVSVKGNDLALRLSNKRSHGYPYSAGEYRTAGVYGYGMYEVSMKPVRQSGVVSSFFLYTGPHEPVKTPHDEIDIEFVGRDTTIVQFNYHTNGNGKNEKIHHLGFDAADSFHAYGFQWRPDFIAWYVDGVEVHRDDGSRTGVPLPSHAGRIMMNLWTGVDALTGWHGPFQYHGPAVASFKSVWYTP